MGEHQSALEALVNGAKGVALSALASMLFAGSSPAPVEARAQLPAFAQQAQQQPEPKNPVPVVSKDKEKELQQLYSKELTAKTPEAIDKLFQDAVKTTGNAPDDLSTRYALLEMARQMALSNYNFSDAFKITDEMAKTYDVNVVGIKAASVEDARKKKKTPEQTEAVTQAGIDVAIAAVNKGMESKNKSFYDFAIKTAKNAQTDAKGLKNIALADMAEIIDKYATDLNGNGANGSLAELKWKYFILNDSKALEGLSTQTTDAKLKKFAGLMSYEKKAPGQYYELGDVAYEAATEKSRPGYEQRVLLEKALENYQSSLSTATGAEKTKYERDGKLKKRVEEIEKKLLANANIVNLLSMIDPTVDQTAGEWKVNNGQLVLEKRATGMLKLPYIPPSEYDLTLVVQTKEGPDTILLGLAKDKARFAAHIDGSYIPNYFTGFEMLDGKNIVTNDTRYQGKLLKAGKASTILCSVRNSGTTLWVDGKKISEYKGNYSNLRERGDYSPPNHNGLFITVWDGAASFSKIQLTPFSGGQGKKTR
jgi:hypothetical protein